MENLTITKIENEVALAFLKENKASREVMFYRKQDVWFGAMIDNKIVGCGGYSHKKNYVYFGGLYVLAEYRKQGIATRLCEARVNENSNKKIIVYARPAACSIWVNKFGFEKKQTYSNGTVKLERNI